MPTLTNEQREKIQAASGALYEEALRQIPAETRRFKDAVSGELLACETGIAWEDFSALADRAIRTGRLWDLWLVPYLTPIFLAVVAEQDEIERVKRAFDCLDHDDAESPRKITSPCLGMASLAVADASIGVLVDHPASPADEWEHARRLARYLNFDAQPSKIEKAHQAR